MKNVTKCLIVISLAGVMTACGADKETAKMEASTPVPTTAPTSAPVASTAPTTAPTKEQPKAEVVAKMTDDEIKRFSEYSKSLKGGPFIKSAKVEGNKAFIEYAKFSEYKGNNTEKAYNDYWLTGDALRKALMEESVRLLREFPTLTEVKIVMAPFDGKKLTTTLDRKSAEEYYKVNLKELHEDKENNLWREKIVNVYFTKQGRDDYEKKFIKVETP